MDNIVLWIVVGAYLTIGLLMLIWCYRRKSIRPKFDQYPVGMALCCIIAGPVLLIIGTVLGIISMVKGHKK